MTTVFIVFWTLMVFGSIAWYTALLFLIGWRGGKEILALVSRLTNRDEN